MENLTQDQYEKDWDETRAKINKSHARNIKLLEKFDDKYDTNLGQWYDNETDALDENLDEEWQEEDFMIGQEDEKTIDVNSPIGPPNPANLELK